MWLHCNQLDYQQCNIHGRRNRIDLSWIQPDLNGLVCNKKFSHTLLSRMTIKINNSKGHIEWLVIFRLCLIKHFD